MQAFEVGGACGGVCAMDAGGCIDQSRWSGPAVKARAICPRLRNAPGFMSTLEASPAPGMPHFARGLEAVS